MCVTYLVKYEKNYLRHADKYSSTINSNTLIIYRSEIIYFHLALKWDKKIATISFTPKHTAKVANVLRLTVAKSLKDFQVLITNTVTTHLSSDVQNGHLNSSVLYTSKKETILSKPT